MTPNKWSAVSIAMQSALAVAITLTAVSKANPAVASWATGTLANGDYVVAVVNGMRQVDGRVLRVAGTTATTAQFEGIDSTNFDTFTSGTLQKITFGNAYGTVASLTASGGDFDFIDITTVHDNIRRNLPGLANALKYDFTHIWDPADAGLIAAKLASDTQSKRAFLFTFSTGAKIVFNGYVGLSFAATGSAQGRVETPMSVTADGAATTYAT